MNSAAVSRILADELFRILINGDGMQVDNAEDAFVAALNLCPILESSEVIAEVKLAAGLNARENTCFHNGTTRRALKCLCVRAIERIFIVKDVLAVS